MSELDDICRRLREQASLLHAMPTQRIAKSLATLAREIIQPNILDLRSDIATQSGLSLPMIDWALRTTFEPLTESSLLEIEAQARDDAPGTLLPHQLAVAVLAGNVFTAVVRALFLPLLLRSPIALRPATSCSALLTHLVRELRRLDPELAPHVHIFNFDHADTQAYTALFQHADAISAYGSDETLDALQRYAPQEAIWIPHGHGFGIAYVCAQSISKSSLSKATARSLALDIAAYDQIGCLSPMAVLVEEAEPKLHETFTENLFQALSEIEIELPRGRLPQSALAAEARWRLVANALGTLHSSQTHSVSYEPGSKPRWSPGYRNIALHTCKNSIDFWSQVRNLGPQLKCVGTPRKVLANSDFRAQMPSQLKPKLCALGTMQTPRMISDADGRRPWYGLFRRQ